MLASKTSLYKFNAEWTCLTGLQVWGAVGKTAVIQSPWFIFILPLWTRSPVHAMKAVAGHLPSACIFFLDPRASIYTWLFLIKARLKKC